MKIILAPDSFKGTLTSSEAASALADGIRTRFPDAEIVSIPIADGGDGTVEALAKANPDSQSVNFDVTGPLGKPVSAPVLKLAGTEIGVIDMASASGLLLVPNAERNPFRPTTYGTGKLIRNALRLPEIESLIIGLGGSATNDCGAGCLQALGFRLLDSNGKALAFPALPRDLGKAFRIDDSNVQQSILNAKVTLACDVDNPLTGERGASRVFGPQKGATPEMVEELEQLLIHFGRVLDNFCISQGRNPVSDRPGAGAAGGLGAALMAAFPNCDVKPGIDIVLDHSGFDQALIGADLVITGEGRLDRQTLGGKAVTGVLKRAQAAGVRVVVVAGSVEASAAEHLLESGVSRVISLTELAGSAEDAMAHAAEFVAKAGKMAVEESSQIRDMPLG